jgi:hypothetical protein
MKKIFVFVAVIAFVAACEKPEIDLSPANGPALKSVVETGNGAPSGAHYNLNIIGVKNKKDATMTDGEGHRIFVLLGGGGIWENTKIKLTMAPEGESFKVLDGNGTDGNGAVFQMPNPDPDGDGITTYTVWARPLGTPGGQADLVPCAIYTYAQTDEFGNPVLDTDGNPIMVEEEVCSETHLQVYRGIGKEKFRDVSLELLFLHFTSDYVLEDGNIIPAGDYSLFDPILQNYFWNYDNNGLKLLQLRFYENPESIVTP